ncbi:MAG: hypothetical protein ACI9N0_003517 [Ilumatobacter sp.]|jgi:hypothetical protein
MATSGLEFGQGRADRLLSAKRCHNELLGHFQPKPASGGRIVVK